MESARRPEESADAKTSRPRVDYFYDETIGNYEYGRHHPMRPHRVRMAHHLVVNYGLYKHMNIFEPKPATFADLTTFHSDEYINFLKSVTPQNMEEPQFRRVLERYNICDDCPIFDGLYDYCQTYTGGSIAGAARINQGCSDIVINWAGGLHHAKRGEASGFCYTNDIVLAILELLKVHPRVLYVDIDIHHGDGVEEAFYLTNRVLTLSFHQSGASFFPRTGHLNDTGGKRGAGYSLNFPLNAGMDDATYKSIFQPVIAKVRRTRAATNPHATLSRAHARCHLTRCVAPSRAAWPHLPTSGHPVSQISQSPIPKRHHGRLTHGVPRVLCRVPGLRMLCSNGSGHVLRSRLSLGRPRGRVEPFHQGARRSHRVHQDLRRADARPGRRRLHHSQCGALLVL